MELKALKNDCSTERIIAYIEGDLSPRDELELEMHFANCKSCAEGLNAQKKLLCALDFALDEGEREFEFPDDFTKVVVTSAESNVRGLRRPQERFNALFICLALFLVLLAGLGSDAATFYRSSGNFFESVWAIGGFAFQLVHDVAVGTAVIIRHLSQRFVFNSAVSLGVLFVFLLITSFVLSRLCVKQDRPKII